METTTSFDLNQAIQRWRENLGQSPAFRSENLYELETHLRDSVATMQARALSLEESFMVATRRIGNSRALETEFGKVNGKAIWLDRILWMLIGIQVWGLASSLTGSIARHALAFGWSNTSYDWAESGLALPVALFALVQVLATAASVGLCWRLIIRKGGKLGAWLGWWLQQRSAFTACCIVLCVLSLLAYASSYSLQVVLIQSIEPATMMYLRYAQTIVWPIQIAAMTAFTLLLARKRLRLSKA